MYYKGIEQYVSLPVSSEPGLKQQDLITLFTPLQISWYCARQFNVNLLLCFQLSFITKMLNSDHIFNYYKVFHSGKVSVLLV